MPFFPRFFSKPFLFSEKKFRLVPQALVSGSSRLYRMQERLNKNARFLDNYQLTGRNPLHQAQGNSSSESEAKLLRMHQSLSKAWADKQDLGIEAIPEETLRRLEEQWMRHAPYSHFSPEELLIAAQYIERSRFLVAQLKREAPRYAVYKEEGEDLKDYLAYLERVEKTLTEQQNYIAESLNARIMAVLKAKDLKAHKPLNNLYKDFKQINPSIKLPEFQRLELTSELPLARALNYCMKKGSAELRTALNKALRLGENTGLIAIRQARELIIIPQSMASLVPTKPAFFSRFSRGHQLRYEFFKEKQELLFRLAAIQMPASDNLSREFKETEWQALEQLTLDVNKEVVDLQFIDCNKLFYKETTEFISQWRELLGGWRKAITEQKLQYLEQLRLEPQPEQTTAPYHFSQVIMHMDMETYSMTNDIKKRWAQLKTELQPSQVTSVKQREDEGVEQPTPNSDSVEKISIAKSRNSFLSQANSDTGRDRGESKGSGSYYGLSPTS